MTQRLTIALHRCQLPARGLWLDLYPILRRGNPYGSTEMSAEDIAVEVRASEQRVRQAIWDLMHHGILRKGEDGKLFSPLMEEERKNDELRREIRYVFSRWQKIGIVHVPALRKTNGGAL